MIRWGPVILLGVAAAACGNRPADTCNPRDVGAPFCVPDSGRSANIDVKLQVKDECTSPCDHGAVACQVRFDGGTTVELALVGQACFDPAASCPAICGFKSYDCALPALPDGTYSVTSKGQPSQQLEVGAGGATGCKLP